MNYAVITLLKGFWRETAIAVLVLVLFLTVPKYYRTKGELDACLGALNTKTITTATAKTEIRLVYRDKSIPCPDVEINTGAEGAVEGPKIAPKRPGMAFSADLGISTGVRDYKAFNTALGLNFGPVRAFTEYDSAGIWRVGAGYVYHFQGAE